MTEDPAPYFPRRLGPESLTEALAAIELAVFDVDGTLTDGTIGYCGTERILLFNSQDGHGIHDLSEIIETAFCTGNRFEAVRTRAEALGVTYVIQGRQDKVRAIEELGIPWGKILVMGDDHNDMVPMLKAGLSIAVANATQEILQVANWVTRLPGGKGAAREVCDMILRAKGYLPLVNADKGIVEWKKNMWPVRPA